MFNFIYNHKFRGLRNDKKKFLVFFDDLTGANILDIFIHRKERLPDPAELLNLENKFFFKKSHSYRKKITQESEDIFRKKNIDYIKRSNLYCDYLNKKCDLIKIMRRYIPMTVI